MQKIAPYKLLNSKVKKKEEKDYEKVADLLYPTMKDKKQGEEARGAVKVEEENNRVNEVDNTTFSDNAWKKTRSFIMGKEGFRSVAYKPTKEDKWTIGYGHTVGVKEGDTITEEKAEELYKQDFKEYSNVLKHVKVPLNDNEKAALTSFIYNVGAENFRTSKMLKKLNLGDKKGAADEFDRWIYQKGNVLKGLVDRRKEEKDLFLSPDE